MGKTSRAKFPGEILSFHTSPGLRNPLASQGRQAYNRGWNMIAGGTAMEYLTVRETAEKWNLSVRTVQQLCTAGRIPGAQKFGTAWAIPAEAEKPRPSTPPPKAGRGGICRRTAEPHQPYAPDEHRLPPGTVPGRGGGHGRGTSAGHCPGRNTVISLRNRRRRPERRGPISPARTWGHVCPPV